MICDGSSTKSVGTSFRLRYGTRLKQRVQRVPELVEERLRRLRGRSAQAPRRPAAGSCTRRWRAAGCRGPPLTHCLRKMSLHAPGVLARPRVEVGVEDAEVRAVPVLHLERRHVRVVDRQVGPADEREAVQLPGQRERAVAHAVEREVRPQRLFVQVEAGLADLLGVVAPVGRLDLESRLRLRAHLLERRGFLDRHLARGHPQPVQQVVDRRRLLRHRLFEREVGVRRVAEQRRPLEPQRGLTRGVLLVVPLVAVVAAARVGREDLPPQLAVVGVRQERPDARRLQAEDPLARELRGLGRLGGALHDVRRESREVLAPLDHQAIRVRVVEPVLVERDAERRQLRVDRPQPGLRRLVEVRAAPDEVLVGVVEQLALRAREAEPVALLPDRLDPREQPPVHPHVVDVRRQHRRRLAVGRLQRVVRLRRRQAPEHEPDLLEQDARVLQRLHGVGERRRRRAAAIASTSRRCSSMPALKAGMKCSGLISVNGGTPNGVVHSFSSGFAWDTDASGFCAPTRAAGPGHRAWRTIST